MTSDSPTDPRGPARGHQPEARPRPRPAAADACATACPPVVETEAGPGRGLRGHRRRHRPGRDRRRARVGLPLLLARLPDPAAPRGRRHRARRPDRLRVAGPAAGGARGHRVDPARRHPGPALPAPRSGCSPTALFDTELAGRLLGYPRVGLATLVETLLGYRLAKEHSAVDWSTRPLPEPWLEYAALDVEVLVELRDAARRRAGRDRQGRLGPPGVRPPARLRAARSAVDAWRRTSGLHRVRGRRALGAVRALWETRDEIAEQRDVTPGPDRPRRRDRRRRPGDAHRPGRAAGDQGLPRPRRRALRRPLGRRAARGRRDGRGRPADPLPARRRPAAAPRLGREGPGRRPAAGAGPRGDDRARRASTTCRSRTCSPPTTCAARCGRRPRPASPATLLDAVADQLAGYGARSWQIALAAPVLTTRSSRPTPRRPAPSTEPSQPSPTEPSPTGSGARRARRSVARGPAPCATSSSICCGDRLEVEDRHGQQLVAGRAATASSSAGTVSISGGSCIVRTAGVEDRRRASGAGPAAGSRRRARPRGWPAPGSPPGPPGVTDVGRESRGPGSRRPPACWPRRRDMHRPVMSPTVAPLSSTGIGITSKSRPGTCRSSGTSER